MRCCVGANKFASLGVPRAGYKQPKNDKPTAARKKSARSAAGVPLLFSRNGAFCSFDFLYFCFIYSCQRLFDSVHSPSQSSKTMQDNVCSPPKKPTNYHGAACIDEPARQGPGENKAFQTVGHCNALRATTLKSCMRKYITTLRACNHAATAETRYSRKSYGKKQPRLPPQATSMKGPHPAH